MLQTVRYVALSLPAYAVSAVTARGSLTVWEANNMRKVAIAFISVVVFLLSGFVWMAEAYCPYPRCVIRPSGARLRAVCVRVEGVPPGPCPTSHDQGCCKQYGKWHCPCPPKQ